MNCAYNTTKVIFVVLSTLGFLVLLDAQPAMTATRIASLQIKTDLLPTSAIVGIPYQISLSAEGRMPPYEWTVEGNLPKGVSLDKTSGKLTGTPKQPGKFQFKIITIGKPPPLAGRLSKV